MSFLGPLPLGGLFVRRRRGKGVGLLTSSKNEGKDSKTTEDPSHLYSDTRLTRRNWTFPVQTTDQTKVVEEKYGDPKEERDGTGQVGPGD